MAEARLDGADRVIRWMTTLSVIVLAIIAAIVSYKHMYLLVRRYGETSWTAALLPISVDGMIAGGRRQDMAGPKLPLGPDTALHHHPCGHARSHDSGQCAQPRSGR